MSLRELVMQMLTNEPWRDEQARQDAMEAYAAKFPVCDLCGHSLVASSTVILIEGRFDNKKWYCDECARVLTNDEMQEVLGID